ncbi:MAG: hypothetical protein ACYS0D_15190, partial [Planctomycetota bacterium]
MHDSAVMALALASVLGPPVPSGGGGDLLPGAEPMLRVAYLIPSNRVPQTDGATNLASLVELISGWCCEYMDRNGFGPLSFRFETTEDGATPMIHVVDVAETDTYLRGDIWGRVNDAASAAGVPIWTPG